MNREEVEKHIEVLEVRERLIDHLAIFVGMRPGEILALQRKHIQRSCTEVVIGQRVYRGEIDTPKTESSKRTVAIPRMMAGLLMAWMEFVGTDPDAWVFPSENPSKPLWRDNVWYRHMKPRLEKVGLAWANFQVMRRTHASLAMTSVSIPRFPQTSGDTASGLPSMSTRIPASANVRLRQNCCKTQF